MSRDEEIKRIEESLTRYDEADPDEVETAEYRKLFKRLNRLRAERDKDLTRGFNE